MNKLINKIIASLGLSQEQKDNFKALVMSNDLINLSTTKAENGLNIRGIQVANESRLSTVPEYVAFEESLVGSNIALLVNQGKDSKGRAFDTPMVSVVSSTSQGQSKTDKEEMFA